MHPPKSVRLVTETAAERIDRFRLKVGLPPAGERLPRRTRMWGWIGPLLMAAVAAVLRLWNINEPHSLVFDETYYVKDAYTLDQFGFATEWDKIPDPLDTSTEPEAKEPNWEFIEGDYTHMRDNAAYVVHGDVGKWAIALGMRLFGATSGLGWRFSAVVAGVLCVLIVGRVAMRLFRSPALATMASGLLAVDGSAIVLSRTGLLDVFLALFILVAFWALLVDRGWSRARLAEGFAADEKWWRHRTGPIGPLRPWLMVAGVALGLAAGTKWSGFYAAAAFGLAAFWWDVRDRRRIGVVSPLAGGVLQGGVPAFMSLVPATLVTYVASYFSWFTHDQAYMRNWAVTERLKHGTELPTWIPDPVISFIEYHRQVLEFHAGVVSEHTYMATPFGWLLQIRPTSFYWRDIPTGAESEALCGAERCVRAITSVGNPAVWWAGALALILVIYVAMRFKDARAGAILAGYAATYVPWLGIGNRTVFTFYTVAIGPFVVLALVYAIGVLSHTLPLGTAADPDGRRGETWFIVPWAARAVRRSELRKLARLHGDPRGRRRGVRELAARLERLAGTFGDDASGLDPVHARSARFGILAGGIVLALAVVFAIFWFPIWTGMPVPYWFWRAHMWLPTWV